MDKKIDNPWLLWFVPLFLIGIGTVAGWIFGPIFFPIHEDPTPDVDVYARASFQFSEYGALCGAGLAVIIAVFFITNLKRFPKKDAVELPAGEQH